MSDASLVDHRGRPRVAVTGMGVKTPAGTDLDSFWATLRAGRATAGPIQAFDASNEPVRIACEVLDFDPEAYFGPKEVRRQDRVTQLGFAAAADALADAGEITADPGRCAVIASSGIGGLHTLEVNCETYFEKGPSRVSPFFVPMMMPNATAGVISMRFGWTGPALCIATACAAGSNAIGEGVRLVRDESSDVVIAGGTEFPITRITLAAFARMGALCTRNDEPLTASRPFDVDRDGFVIGEGAAFLVLESLEHARARGARIYGEVAGYGRNADAYHITAPSPGGIGAATCMQQALDDAGLTGRHRARERARHVDGAQRRRRGRSDPQGVRRRRSPGHVEQGLVRPHDRRGRRRRSGRIACCRSATGSCRRRPTANASPTRSRSTS